MHDEFSRFHPLINFIYFATVITFSAIYTEPILLLISLLSATVYSICLEGKKSLKISLKFILPVALFAAAINIAFNHKGMTILGYLPGGNPLTLESVIYGLCSAGLFACVILWFFCLNKVMSSDKFIYLFGRLMPSISLIISMALRSIPLFKKQHNRVIAAQKSLQKNSGKNRLLTKLRHGVNVFSIMLTWSLESSIITADSMNSRGYGLKGRTAFSYYRFYLRDGILLVLLLLLIILQILITVFGGGKITFYPYYEFSPSALKYCGYAVYTLLCTLPIIINITEDMKWNYFQSRI